MKTILIIVILLMLTFGFGFLLHVEQIPADPLATNFENMSFADLNAWDRGLEAAMRTCTNPATLDVLCRAHRAAIAESLRRSAASINAATANYGKSHD
jgi:hypothetical protein